MSYKIEKYFGIIPNNNKHFKIVLIMALPQIVAPLSDKTMQNISCPISQDVMQYPVCTPDGNTYDRDHIIEWIKRNHTCPLTRLPLNINDLVPNKSLKCIIEGYVNSGRLPPFPLQQKNPNVDAVELLGFVNVPSSRPNVSLPSISQATFNTGPLSPVDIPTNPNFDFISDTHSRRMISTAYIVVKNMGEWDFIRRYNPTSYMTDRNERILAISHQIDEKYQGHSGASLSYTLRTIQFIAKNGFEAFKRDYVRS